MLLDLHITQGNTITLYTKLVDLKADFASEYPQPLNITYLGIRLDLGRRIQNSE